MTSATSLGRRLVFFLLSQRPVMLSRGSRMCWTIPCSYGFLRACSRRRDGSREVPEGDDLGACFDDRTRTGPTPMVRYIADLRQRRPVSNRPSDGGDFAQKSPVL